MLQALDVLIGFTLVMLILSMAVTMITQYISGTLFNMRGTALRQGIGRLLALMDEGLKLGEAQRITDHTSGVGPARPTGRPWPNPIDVTAIWCRDAARP